MPSDNSNDSSVSRSSSVSSGALLTFGVVHHFAVHFLTFWSVLLMLHLTIMAIAIARKK